MSNHPVQTVSTSNDKFKVILAIVAVVAGVAAFYILANQSTLVRASALVAGLIVAIGLAWTSEAGQGFINFARESVRETKKVVWPTRKEAMQITAVVFGFVLLMSIFLWGTDKILEYVLLELVLGWKK
ncbi:preprotein translocase subunit SecE [Undibacterium sp.]|jgi:preprotein translocase subunit SecE|uniref:preprotein translocase subunit SecE n=1 Tax=Undibacterium sp. TaxID=1914977 RepID=UPI002B983C02|nr:preprotein translocase subunit SecE [Undibacterium sp.]HTD02709.1 preprotein translocase subunit SecE [Undibacterium sp.]